MPLLRREDADRVRQLLDHLTVVDEQESIDAVFDQIDKARGPFVVSFVNAHAVNVACNDEEFHRALMGSDLLLRDGTGMWILCEAMGVEAGQNMNGTDFIPKLLERYRGRKVALCGTEDQYLSAAAQHIDNPVLVIDGFREVEDYRHEVEQAAPDLVVLGMGMPKQERVAATLKESLVRDVAVVNGGAIFDFMAGRVPRAPRWMRITGMEWVYRLAKEPRRLWRRYVLGNVVFLFRVADLRLRGTAP